MTRYFMTVNEAVGLVLQSATLGEGGEIFVLDMGLPMKIADLARQLIELSGLEPDTDIEIKYTGLRPGEKLFEELNHKTENMVATEHAKVMRFLSQPQTLEQIEAGFDAVKKAGASGDSDQLNAVRRPNFIRVPRSRLRGECFSIQARDPEGGAGIPAVFSSAPRC